MIYFLRRADGAIKIGTTENFYARRAQLKSEHGALELLGLMDGDAKLERQLHQRFSHLQIPGKEREWFSAGQDLLAYIVLATHLNMPTKQREFFIRTSTRTDKAIAIVAGEMQMQSGLGVSADEAIWCMIQAAFPEVAREVEAKLGSKSDSRDDA